MQEEQQRQTKHKDYERNQKMDVGHDRHCQFSNTHGDLRWYIKSSLGERPHENEKLYSPKILGCAVRFMV